MRKRVLFLAAEPLRAPAIALGQEFSKMQDSTSRLEFIYRGMPQAEDLQSLFYEYKPNIVHFAGHGIQDGSLVFEDNDRQPRLIGKGALVELFRLFSANIECVLLNACYSDSLAEEISDYIGSVIGMSRSIHDHSAIAFSGSFYRAIDNNESYKKAFELGKNQIQLQDNYLNDLSEDTVPIFYGNHKSSQEDYLTDKSSQALENVKRPEGPLPLESNFYVKRDPVEEECYSEILYPGALIRIKAPRKMGKSSLMRRILNHSKKINATTSELSIQSIDNDFFRDLEKFLKCFCICVADTLSITDNLADYWDPMRGSRTSATKYFEKCILNKISGPFVLGLDEVDCIFEHPAIASDFFGMLRHWYEMSRYEEPWKKIRLIIAHSREVYIPLDIHQSPFNVGMPVELKMFNQVQINELAKRYQISSKKMMEDALSFLGGHPYLVSVAFYEFSKGKYTWKQLMRIAPTESGPYSAHLRRHLDNLLSDKSLGHAMKKILLSTKPIRIGTNETFKLHGMGLIKRIGNDTELLCDLYRLYFQERLELES